MPAQARTISSCRMLNPAAPREGKRSPSPEQDFSPHHKTECLAQESASQSVGTSKRLFGLTNFTRCLFKTHRSFVPNRPGFLHYAVSKPPRPPSSRSNLDYRGRGRDGSDTVLPNIGRCFPARSSPLQVGTDVFDFLPGRRNVGIWFACFHYDDASSKECSTIFDRTA